MFDFYRKLNRTSRVIVMACLYAFFCNGNLSLLVGSVMPDLKTAYGLSDTVSGLLISAHAAGNLAAGFLSGLVPLWLGRKRGIMVTAGLAYVGYAVSILTGNPAFLVAAFLCVGFGRGSVTNFNSRTINLLTDGSPVATNVLHAVFAIGAIVVPMVFLLLRNAISWQAGVIYVILLGVTEQLFFARMQLEDDHPQRSDKKNRTLVFMKDPAYLVLALMMFCYLCSEYTLNGWLVTYIQSKETLLAEMNASGTTITAFSQSMATLLWAVMLVGRLVCAYLSTRIGQKQLMMVFSIAMAGFFFMLLNAGSVNMVAVSVACLGFSMAGICPMIYSDAVWYTNTYPMATSMLLGIGSLGAIIMPSVVGSIAEQYGFNGGMKVILVTIVLLCLFAAANVFMKPKKDAV